MEKQPKIIPTWIFDWIAVDPITGVITWKRDRPANDRKTGDVAGSVNQLGYIVLSVCGQKYLAHRIVFYFVNGHCPLFIDHRDKNRQNNSIGNLRPATKRENMLNRGKPIMPRPPASKFKGVTFDRSRRLWFAQIRSDGIHKNLGRYATEIEAATAYDAAAIRLHGEFASGNFI